MTHPRAAQWHSLVTDMRPVTVRIVGEAKKLMQCGLSMTEAAKDLNVLASDLDRQLMAHLGESPESLCSPVRRLKVARL